MLKLKFTLYWYKILEFINSVKHFTENRLGLLPTSIKLHEDIIIESKKSKSLKNILRWSEFGQSDQGDPNLVKVIKVIRIQSFTLFVKIALFQGGFLKYQRTTDEQ